MYSEKDCLENLKQIVSEYADDENIKNLSLDELRSSYSELADNIYCISLSNCLKYKNMIWNIDNLKTDIRSKFQTELFNTWHSIYMKSTKTDPTEDPPETKEKDSTSVMEVEKSLKAVAQEQISVITKQQPFDSKKQKSIRASEAKDLNREMKPLENQTPTIIPKPSVQKFEDDWFDKLLEFFAAIIGGMSGIVGH
jgi:hypothetical protein